MAEDTHRAIAPPPSKERHLLVEGHDRRARDAGDRHGKPAGHAEHRVAQPPGKVAELRQHQGPRQRHIDGRVPEHRCPGRIDQRAHDALARKVGEELADAGNRAEQEEARQQWPPDGPNGEREQIRRPQKLGGQGGFPSGGQQRRADVTSNKQQEESQHRAVEPGEARVAAFHSGGCRDARGGSIV